ncbi:hypothetical protein AFAEC_1121 [Aliarcobacter faecis]|uniref:hypothetical protein n=1 Tax=Aliarcobacter faecis TaxID=1564138 RepID=UPI00047E019F|nr:hypothetical protein [Aliarcobacter faecis]QKF73284.1 hypothetical protein AFAEC_1118 [Aliarcobacter faecis]QKF73287.1 hypothetical protein AFAEC_1121 [Aliarcobacter faecis]
MKLICPLCFSKIEENKKGRPKQYCSLECQEIEKFFSAFENRLLKKIQNNGFENKSQNRLKSRLFSLANNLKCS